MTKKINNKCLSCKNQKIEFLFKSSDYITNENFSIYHCKTCDLIFPLNIPNNLDNYYPKQYRSYFLIIDKILKILSKRFVQNINNKYFKNIDDKKILEIGCGDGSMLKHFKNINWQVYGKERKIIIDNQNKLNITDKDIKDYNDNSLDLILMHNSLEHLRNPKEIIKNSVKKLKNKGLIIITVPSHESLQFKFGKKDWLHLDTPRHLNIFSLKSFNNLIKETNVKIVSHKSVSLYLEFYGWFQTIINKISRDKNSFFKFLMKIDRNKFIFSIGFLQLIVLIIPCIIISLITNLLNKGSTVEIVLKKE